MKIKCLKCNDVIESKNLHNCISCKCGACSIDGGNQYTRIGGDPHYINLISEDGTEKSLVSGSQVTKVHSKYWWNNKLEECDEYKLEFRTKESSFSKIENEIKKIHDYEVAEISYTEITNASNDFLSWIDKMSANTCYFM